MKHGYTITTGLTIHTCNESYMCTLCQSTYSLIGSFFPPPGEFLTHIYMYHASIVLASDTCTFSAAEF